MRHRSSERFGIPARWRSVGQGGGWLGLVCGFLGGLSLFIPCDSAMEWHTHQTWAGEPDSATPLYQAAIIQEAEALRLPDGSASHNHSPSLVETPQGDLLVAWFHGRGERRDDSLVILGSRRKPGADWSEPFLLADHPDLPDQNPTLFIDSQQRLWLFRVSSLDNEVRGYFPTYLISTDYEGTGPPRWTWQAPLFCRPRNLEAAFETALQELEQAGIATEKQRAELRARRELAREKLWHRLGWLPRLPPLMLTEHRMILGLYSDVWDCSLLAFTEDGGQTWEFSEPMFLPDTLLHNSIQPGLVRKRNGNLVAFMRSAPRVQRAESKDGGLTWRADPLDIPCPHSSVAVVGLRNGNWVLAVNDTDGRHRLTLYLTEDEGQTWKWKRTLEDFPRGKGAGHYPTLIQTYDDTLHIVYTYENAQEFQGKTIKHVQLNEAWIRSGAQKR